MVSMVCGGWAWVMVGHSKEGEDCVCMVGRDGGQYGVWWILLVMRRWFLVTVESKVPVTAVMVCGGDNEYGAIMARPNDGDCVTCIMMDLGDGVEYGACTVSPGDSGEA